MDDVTSRRYQAVASNLDNVLFIAPCSAWENYMGVYSLNAFALGDVITTPDGQAIVYPGEHTSVERYLALNEYLAALTHEEFPHDTNQVVDELRNRFNFHIVRTRRSEREEPNWDEIYDSFHDHTWQNDYVDANGTPVEEYIVWNVFNWDNGAPFVNLNDQQFGPLFVNEPPAFGGVQNRVSGRVQETRPNVRRGRGPLEPP